MTMTEDQLSKAPDKLTDEQALDRVERSMQRGPYTFMDRWVYSGYRSLRFEDSAMFRLGSVLGWIYGVSIYDRIYAARLAGWFCDALDRLASHGLDGPEPHIPANIVRLVSDSCFGSFGFAIHRVEESTSENMENRLEGEGYFYGMHNEQSVFPRLYQVNRRHWIYGGLIYHPDQTSHSGGAPQFTVRLDSSCNPWSLHT